MKAFRNRLTVDSLIHYVAVPASFLTPILILYSIDPNSFETSFAGRSPYIIFLWLFLLELIVSQPIPRSGILNRKRLLASLALMTIPTLYAIGLVFFDLGRIVTEIGKALGVPYDTFGNWFIDVAWPISFEHIVFALSFTAIMFIVYRVNGVKKLAIPLFFFWATTFFSILNTFAPYGAVWMLQALVPLTARSTASVLELMGYQTFLAPLMDSRGAGTLLVVANGGSSFPVAIYWPSAGIHSLFIYSITILLFIKDASFTRLQKTACFVIGAIGTFAANVARIVTICIVGLSVGASAAQLLHDYYGEVFFISWMIIYVSAIAFGPRFKKWVYYRLGRDKDKTKSILAD
jgi:thaumarchaeosortase